MNPFYIGIPAFLGGTLIGYGLREFSLGRISAEQLGNLSMSMRPTRLRYLWVMLSILAAFLLVRFSLPSLTDTWFLLFLFLAAVVSVGFEVHGFRQFFLGNLPHSFVRPYMISRLFTLLGVLALIGAMAATSFVSLS